jgi:hypothetical protein
MPQSFDARRSLPASAYFALALVVSLAAHPTPADGFQCPPGQPHTVWQPVSGYGVSMSNGESCGFGQPTLDTGGNLVWPGGQTATSNGPQVCLTTTKQWLSTANYGCGRGASYGVFGEFTIPPQGGTFGASAGITVTRADMACNNDPFSIVLTGNFEPTTYTQAGRYYFAIYLPAFYDPATGGAHQHSISTISNVCLRVNGGAGSAQILGASSRLAPACPADLDDGSGTGTSSGGVDVNDLLFFLSAFEAGTPAADLDDGSGSGIPEGNIDINDLLFFLARFAAGC